MARGVLERVGLADVFGGRDDGPPPPSPQAALGEVFKMPPRPRLKIRRGRARQRRRPIAKPIRVRNLANVAA
jgi:hypothetical protein